MTCNIFLAGLKPGMLGLHGQCLKPQAQQIVKLNMKISLCFIVKMNEVKKSA